MKCAKKETGVYKTKDGALIRELMHPDHHPVGNQSLAEAVIAPGLTTHLHRHHRSEEIYHVLQGRGEMTLEGERFAISKGDTVLIPPGSAHCVSNKGPDELVILCSCAPAYSHRDTELLTP